MEKQKKVVDASVVFKFYDQTEENAEIAVKLRDLHINKEIEITIPELLFLEVTNGLKWKNNKNNFLDKITKSLFDLGFTIEKLTEKNLSIALEISVKYGITVYDALYVAIAQENRCELITADKELYKIPNVLPLEKFQ